MVSARHHQVRDRSSWYEDTKFPFLLFLVQGCLIAPVPRSKPREQQRTVTTSLFFFSRFIFVRLQPPDLQFEAVPIWPLRAQSCARSFNFLYIIILFNEPRQQLLRAFRREHGVWRACGPFQTQSPSLCGFTLVGRLSIIAGIPG